MRLRVIASETSDGSTEPGGLSTRVLRTFAVSSHSAAAGNCFFPIASSLLAMSVCPNISKALEIRCRLVRSSVSFLTLLSRIL